MKTPRAQHKHTNPTICINFHYLPCKNCLTIGNHENDKLLTNAIDQKTNSEKSLKRKTMKASTPQKMGNDVKESNT